MQVTDEFEWRMQIGQHRISSDRKPLSTLPQLLTTVSALRRVIEGVESLKFCPGNEDDKYFSVQAARKGIFKDSTGKICMKKLCLKLFYLIRIKSGCIVCERSLQLPYHSLCVL